MILWNDLRADLAPSWVPRRHQRAPKGRPRGALGGPRPPPGPRKKLPGTPKMPKTTRIPENGLARLNVQPFWHRFSKHVGSIFELFWVILTYFYSCFRTPSLVPASLFRRPEQAMWLGVPGLIGLIGNWCTDKPPCN